MQPLLRGRLCARACALASAVFLAFALLAHVDNSTQCGAAAVLRKPMDDQPIMNNGNMAVAQILNCIICADPIEQGQGQGALNCGHHVNFHQACLDHWRALKNTCPLCQVALPDFQAQVQNNINLGDHMEVDD